MKISAQFESRHATITLIVDSKTTEGHSLLSSQKEAYKTAADQVVSPAHVSVSGLDDFNALQVLRSIDTVVEEHMLTKR